MERPVGVRVGVADGSRHVFLSLFHRHKYTVYAAYLLLFFLRNNSCLFMSRYVTDILYVHQRRGNLVKINWLKATVGYVVGACYDHVAGLVFL